MRVLVADDEMTTREGIRTFVPWADYGIDEVITAANGQEALELAKQQWPELIISDIRMPRLNGLEFAQALRAVHPACQIIFISSYSDKEYLKQAIALKAVSYVEKPVELPELLNAISQAVSAVRQEQEQAERLLLAQSIQSDAVFDLISDTPEACLPMLPEHFQACASYFSILVFGQPELMLQQSKIKKLLFQRASAFAACLCHDCRKPENAMMLFHLGLPQAMARSAVRSALKPEPGTFLAVGSCVDSVLQLRSSYLTAEHAGAMLFFRGYGKTAFSEDAPTLFSSLSDAQLMFPEQLIALVREERYGEGALLIRSISAQLTAATAEPAQIRNLFARAVMLLNRQSAANSLSPEQLHTLFQKSTLQALQDELLAQLERCEKSLEAQPQRKTTNVIIRYLEQEFSNSELSISMVSEHIHLTPSHISHIFKADTGMSIKQYLLEYRISAAKKLLKNRDRKLQEIARLCGFQDANYFSKIFRRSVGMTPSEYREKS